MPKSVDKGRISKLDGRKTLKESWLNGADEILRKKDGRNLKNKRQHMNQCKNIMEARMACKKREVEKAQSIVLLCTGYI